MTKKLTSEEIDVLLQGITNDQAEISDIGGDSDAEDDVLISVSTCSNRSSRSETSNSDFGNISKTFQASSTPVSGHSKRKRRINYSSDSQDSEAECEADVQNFGIDSPKRANLESRLTSSSSSDESNDNSSEIHWSKPNRQPVAYKSFNFVRDFGPKTVFSNVSPLKSFRLFFSLIFSRYIMDQTVLYGQQNGVVLNITIEQFNAWIGMLMLMGINVLPSMRSYWSSNEYLRNNNIANIMPLRTFLKILRCLHVNDNTAMPPRGSSDYDRLFKIRPMIEYLNQTFGKRFNPSRQLSIDESMIGFKGRSTMKQYMPLKPTKRGYKVWAMACAVTGYLVGFEIYQGRSVTGEPQLGLGETVVLKLSKVLEGLGYCIFFDNFFSSVPLLVSLLTKKIFACGTIRVDRKGFPKENLSDSKKMKKLDKDFTQSGDISVCKWLDKGKKPVCVISNMHKGNEEVDVLRTNKTGQREIVNTYKSISDYNIFMGGVDRFDQLLATYAIGWKSRRWWMRIFYYMLDCAIVNSYINYKEGEKKKKQKYMTHLEYRLELANELISGYTCRKRCLTKSKHSLSKSKLENVGYHIPVLGTYRRCAYCCTKEKQKRSNLICSSCNVALCKPCFSPFHCK